MTDKLGGIIETKHTPGPWEWINSNTDEPFNFSTRFDGIGMPSLRTVAVFGEDKVEVIDGKRYTSFALPKFILDAEPFPDHAEVNKANAHLIAAAPELLDACQLLLVCMKLSGWEGDYAAEKGREAIAKALGERNDD